MFKLLLLLLVVVLGSAINAGLGLRMPDGFVPEGRVDKAAPYSGYETGSGVPSSLFFFIAVVWLVGFAGVAYGGALVLRSKSWWSFAFVAAFAYFVRYHYAPSLWV